MYTSTAKEIRFSQILANECKVYGTAEPVLDELEQLRAAESGNAQDREKAGSILKAAVEKLSGGSNTVLFDENGIPSVMVIVPLIRMGDMPGMKGNDAPHPAFVVNGKPLQKVYVSKYINCLIDGKAASLPMCEPGGLSCFDDAVKTIKGKGRGWMPMPLAMRMAICLKLLNEGRDISGNTDCGRDYYRHDECGIQADNGTVLTGSGPLTWTHNGKADGIWDLVGNLNELDGGFRLLDGEINLMDIADMADPSCDYGKDSALWYALDANGNAVRPGTPGALHFDGKDGTVRVTSSVENHGLGNCAFCDVTAEEGLEIPEILKLIGLYPIESGLSERLGWRWINTEGESLPLCGGAFLITNHSGMFFMGATKQRDVRYKLSGIRSVYIPVE